MSVLPNLLAHRTCSYRNNSGGVELIRGGVVHKIFLPVHANSGGDVRKIGLFTLIRPPLNYFDTGSTTFSFMSKKHLPQICSHGLS